MTRINIFRNTAETNSVAWGKQARGKQIWGKNTSALVFAAVLIVCSVAVGCSSDKPKPVTTNTQIPVAQSPAPVMPAPVMQAETKPAPKKVVHRKPATVNYTDKTYGLAFEYPRRYAIETGDAAADLVMANPVPMNFVQPGGLALAAVELPETGFANTDFSSAFFNVSVNKTLTTDQCNSFAVPQPKVVTPTASNDSTTTSAVTAPSETQPTSTQSTPASSDQATTTKSDSTTASAQSEPQGSKLLIGDLELRATEAVSGEGTRQSDSKYFHVYQNGACYEFALNVTTIASEDRIIKHVDRDKVFSRLEQILATVKINPVVAPEVTAEAPAVSETPAQ